MKIYVHSLGCKTNEYETSALLSAAKKQGIAETKAIEEADYIILNTCAVTSLSEKKSRQAYHRFRRLSPRAKILVMGCAAEKCPEAFLDADVLLGTTCRDKALSKLLSLKEGEHYAYPKAPFAPRCYEELGEARLLEGARATLKIQDGCSNFCSYCLIPFLRGAPRSRNLESVIEEAKSLTNHGVKELVLTGTHIGFYGHDLEEGTDLAYLCKKILEACPSLLRLRLGSLEESELSDDLLALFGKEKRLAHHLHIPLQSGSASTLKRMRRKYTPEEFFYHVSRLKEVLPSIALTTDVIVGFPNESEEEFAETLSFVQKVGFARIHVFPYSKREGTLASSLVDLPSEVKKERVKRLMKLSSQLEDAYIAKRIGQKEFLLVEEVKDGIAKGHTSSYLKIALPSLQLKSGDIVEITIEKSIVEKYDS